MSTSDAQKRATAKYQKERVQEIKFRVPMGQKQIIQAHAKRTGESVNAFIYRAVREAMERDNKQGHATKE
jgi:predicted HicB family RNase H-like nuclease